MDASAQVDWKLKENAAKHQTFPYQGSELVVRRALPFLISLVVPRDEKSLTFTVERGSTPALHAKTRISFGLSGDGPGGDSSSSSWSAARASSAAAAAPPGAVSFSIASPANAAVGRYRMNLKTGPASSSLHLGTFVLLFNPWAPADEVFLPKEEERQEYVLTESGVIFVGSARSISPRGWNYGQFHPGILEICLSILDRSLNYRKDSVTDLLHRHDPKYVGRVLSAMINSNDDNGVLQGNWSGNYSGGSSPGSWSGSVDILQKWKASGFRPVRYGQCWVFAGVLTTVLRCLGLPARTISNFNSAHDTDQTLTIDEYYDNSGNPLNITSDSVWNFHVWNESWFARSDLGATYNGWQLLDATPQERSKGIFQCGPASVLAIKEGDVHLLYDLPFGFAEVNADRVTWIYDTATGQKKKIYSETKNIGQYISTKAVGRFSRQDVTDNYKYKEGTPKEREVFQKACDKLNLEYLGATAAQQAKEKPDVAGTFKIQSTPQVGKDVELVLRMTNLASTAKSMTVSMAAWTIIYTGKVVHEVWKSSQQMTLGPQEEKAIPIKISYAEYQKHLTTDNMIRASALCHINEGHDALVERDVTLNNPTLAVKVLGPVKVGQEVQVEMVFTNPLEEEVKDCILQAEGSGLLEAKLKMDVAPVKAKQSSRVQFGIKPSKSGTQQLQITFSCNRFPDNHTFEVIEVGN